jgi:hypothetical protein
MKKIMKILAISTPKNLGRIEEVMQPYDMNPDKKCKACGQPAFSDQFCWYCNEMREELKCWPK